MFYDKYLALCVKNNVAPSRVALDCGITKGSVSHWKKTGITPNKFILMKIANYFEISVSELLDEDAVVETDKKTELSENNEQLTKKDIELINWFRSLPVEKQKAILAIGDAPKGLV